MGIGRAGERLRTLGTGVAAVVLAAGALTLGTGLSHATETCAGLDAARRAQVAAIAELDAGALPDPRLPGRQRALAVLDHRRAAAGCPTVPATPPPPVPPSLPVPPGTVARVG